MGTKSFPGPACADPSTGKRPESRRTKDPCRYAAQAGPSGPHRHRRHLVQAVAHYHVRSRQLPLVPTDMRAHTRVDHIGGPTLPTYPQSARSAGSRRVGRRWAVGREGDGRATARPLASFATSANVVAHGGQPVRTSVGGVRCRALSRTVTTVAVVTYARGRAGARARTRAHAERTRARWELSRQSATVRSSGVVH